MFFSLRYQLRQVPVVVGKLKMASVRFETVYPAWRESVARKAKQAASEGTHTLAKLITVCWLERWIAMRKATPKSTVIVESLRNHGAWK